MGEITYPSAIAPYTFREGYNYRKYLEDQSHFDNLATDIDQSIAKLALSNAEAARLSTEAIVENQLEVANQISQGLEATRVGLERLDDSIVDLRQSVNDVRSAIAEVRYSVESGFRLTAQRLNVIEGVLRDLLEAVKSPEKTWALEKFDIAKDLYRRELYEDALSYLNDALHGHGEHRGYIFDPRAHMLKGNILLGDGENFEPNLIDLPAAKRSFDEAVKYAKPPRDMLAGVDEARQEELFQPRVFARCSSAWASYVQGHIPDAEAEYREAIKEGPNDARAHYFLGKVLAHQGRFGEAEEALDKAIRVNFYYVAQLAADQDYLRERKRFEKRVAAYRQELLQRLRPFANTICLLRGKNPERLYSGNRKYDNIRTISLSEEILDGRAEIGPMVSHYDQLKRDAVQTGELIEEVAKQADYLVSSAKDQKGYISKPSDSSIRYFDSERVAEKQRTIGWLVAGGLVVLGVITRSGDPFSFAAFAAGYALIGAPLIASIAESNHKNRERRRLDSEYRSQISEADQEISQAMQRSEEAKEILSNYRRLAPDLSIASG